MPWENLSTEVEELVGLVRIEWEAIENVFWLAQSLGLHHRHRDDVYRKRERDKKRSQYKAGLIPKKTDEQLRKMRETSKARRKAGKIKPLTDEQREALKAYSRDRRAKIKAGTWVPVKPRRLS